ncbi:MAG: S1/P1 nuclease [Bacteroidota bacterium]
MKKVLIFFLLLSVVVPAAAWGVTGHRAIGLIAERLLNAKAKKKLEAILSRESIAMTSNWMDEIRSDSTWNHTADWHWVTIETGKRYEDSPKNPKGDIIATLERLMEEIRTRKVTGVKEAEHVKMIIHLIGDIHQPLHVGCCDDQGGNRVRLKWFRDDSNLHRLWDSDLIDHSRLSYTELADALVLPDATVVKTLQTATVRQWAVESMDVRERVYAIGDGKLGYAYAYRNNDLMKKRLLEAGVRLAGVLNALYGK